MKITRRNVEMNTCGNLPQENSIAPALNHLVKGDGTWDHFNPASVAGKYIVLNIFPSIDTPTCAASVKAFNEKAANLENTHVLCVSKDLPPALVRFCGAEGIKNLTTVSAYRPDCSFGHDYGIQITDGAGENGAFNGLFGRAVVVVSPTGKVIHQELVAELANQPNYDACLAKIQVHQAQSNANNNTTTNSNNNRLEHIGNKRTASSLDSKF